MDLTTVHADLRTWTPPVSRFDLVLLSYIHLPQPYRGRVHRAAAAALRPGGSLVLVAHDRSNADDGVGGPDDPALLPTGAEVAQELERLKVTRAEVGERAVSGVARPARDLLVVAHRPPDRQDG